MHYLDEAVTSLVDAQRKRLSPEQLVQEFSTVEIYADRFKKAAEDMHKYIEDLEVGPEED